MFCFDCFAFCPSPEASPGVAFHVSSSRRDIDRGRNPGKRAACALEVSALATSVVVLSADHMVTVLFNG
jgi:hypothetical protein